MYRFISRKKLINLFANHMAEIHKKADIEYYIVGDKLEYSYLLDRIIPIVNLTNDLGITKEVYSKAINIYDFTNSGKHGYILHNGKIIKK